MANQADSDDQNDVSAASHKRMYTSRKHDRLRMDATSLKQQLGNAGARPAETAPLLERVESASSVDEGQRRSSHGEAIEAGKPVATKVYSAAICCPVECELIHSIIAPLPGVVSVETCVVTKVVTVVHYESVLSPAAIVAALNDASLEACLSGHLFQAASVSWMPTGDVILCGMFLLLSLLSYLPLPGAEHMMWLALVSAAAGCPAIISKAWSELRQFYLGIHTLALVASAGAIVLGDYEEAASIIFLFGLSEWLEDCCMSRARGALTDILELQPQTAVLAADMAEVAVGQVGVGDIIVVKAGTKVPLDGVVVRGDSVLDESMMTGESKPVTKRPGDELVSGSINCGSAPLQVRVTASAGDSTVARLASLMEQAARDKSRLDRTLERFARLYTPTVVLLAVLTAAVPPLLLRGHDWRHWAYIALVLLVTSCPCALVLSTPCTTVCGLARAAQQGILIRGSRHLEALAAVRAVTLDKSGTLTEGAFSVVAVQPLAALTAQEVLRLAAALEAHCVHPLAAAVVGRVAAEGLACGEEVTDVQVLPGEGVTGKVDGVPVAVGSMRLARALVGAHAAAALAPVAAPHSARGASVCFVLVGGVLCGMIVLADRPRGNAAAALAALRHLGVKAAMLTGDTQAAAAAVAEAVGIPPSATHAELLPADKRRVLAEVRAAWGPVAHVGDGVNDAPALAAADVGVAMGASGAALAIEAADVALFTNDLSNLPFAVRLGRRVARVVSTNMALALACKLAVMMLAFMGHMSLWLSVAADVGSLLAVTLHGVSVLGFERSGLPGRQPPAGTASKAQTHSSLSCCSPASSCCTHESGSCGSNRHMGVPGRWLRQLERLQGALDEEGKGSVAALRPHGEGVATPLVPEVSCTDVACCGGRGCPVVAAGDGTSPAWGSRRSSAAGHYNSEGVPRLLERAISGLSGPLRALRRSTAAESEHELALLAARTESADVEGLFDALDTPEFDSTLQAVCVSNSSPRRATQRVAASSPTWPWQEASSIAIGVAASSTSTAAVQVVTHASRDSGNDVPRDFKLSAPPQPSLPTSTVASEPGAPSLSLAHSGGKAVASNSASGAGAATRVQSLPALLASRLAVAPRRQRSGGMRGEAVDLFGTGASTGGSAACSKPCCQGSQ